MKQPGLSVLGGNDPEAQESQPDQENAQDQAQEGNGPKGAKSSGKSFMGITPEGLKEAAALRPKPDSAFAHVTTPELAMRAQAYSLEIGYRADDPRVTKPVHDQVKQFEQAMIHSQAGMASPDQGAPGGPMQGGGAGGPMAGPPGAGPPGQGGPPGMQAPPPGGMQQPPGPPQ